RGWLFIEQHALLREHVLFENDMICVADPQFRAFAEIGNILVCMTVTRRSPASDGPTASIRPMAPKRRIEDAAQLWRNVAGLLSQSERFDFSRNALKQIDGSPLVYWWDSDFLARYAVAPKLKNVATVREGLGTRADTRFVRNWFEVPLFAMNRSNFGNYVPVLDKPWVPFIKGADARAWIEPLLYLVNWDRDGIQLGTYKKSKFGRGADRYFLQGVAYSTIGVSFTARAHRHASIFSDGGSSAFPREIADAVCVLNGSTSRFVLQSLNPTLNFTNGDVERVPMFPVEDADCIYKTLGRAFTEHEAARETSVEFQR